VSLRAVGVCTATAASRMTVSERYAQEYDARQARYKADRRRFVQETRHREIVYEAAVHSLRHLHPDCRRVSEKLGLPSSAGLRRARRRAVRCSIAQGLHVAAAECAAACPPAHWRSRTVVESYDGRTASRLP